MVTLMNTAGFIGGSAAVLAVLLVVWGVLTTRRLRRLARAVLQAEAAVDHALTQRFSTIAKLDETLAAEAGVERIRIAAVRWQNGVPPNAPIADKAAFAEEIGRIARELESAVARRGETVDRNVADLVTALGLTADQLDNARRLYNATAARMNKTIVAFPSMLAANAMRLEKKPYFEIGAADSDAEQDA